METNLNKLLDLVNETCCELTEGLKPKKKDLVVEAVFTTAQVLLTEIYGEEALLKAAEENQKEAQESLKAAVADLLGIDPDCVQIEGPVDKDTAEPDEPKCVRFETDAADEAEAEAELIEEPTQIVKQMKVGQKAFLTIVKGNAPKSQKTED